MINEPEIFQTDITGDDLFFLCDELKAVSSGNKNKGDN